MRFRASSILGYFPAIFIAVLIAIALPPFLLKAQQTPHVADFEDVAEKAGLTMMNVFGGVDTKKYIIETTGTGVAIFDYDNDGWPDIFVVNGTTLEGVPGAKLPPIISITTIMTAPLPTSQCKPDSQRPAGDKASASEITTTMDGKICT